LVKAGQKTARLVKGTKLRLAGYGYNAGGSKVKVTWTSSNAAVAKVSASGRVTAVKAGRATITLTAGTMKATVKVTVVAKRPAKAKVTKVKVSGVRKSLKVGQVAAITGSWTPATAVGVKVTYKSSKPKVVAIDAAGRATAVGKGKATITVKAGGKAKQYTVRVK
jgi:uncharacterized protein YjdB